MIPLKFFRDKTHVYVNNPDGITKKMSIADFEAMLNGEGGGGDIPEHSSSNQGEVLSVDANGDLVWKTLPPPTPGVTYFDAVVDYSEQTVTCDVTKADIAGMINSGSHPVIRFNAPEGGGKLYEPLEVAYGDATSGGYSFKRYMSYNAGGEPITLTVSGYIMIMLEWNEEDNEMVEEWILDYLTTN